MWLIFRINKNKIEFFKKEITLKLKSETIFFSSKIIINKYFQNKLLKKEFNLLGDYVFCYNSNFSNLEIVNLVKYTRGCKYVLDSFWNSQNQISNFIRSLKKLENKDGYISRNFYPIQEKIKYKFKSGPFTDQIFKILKVQKNNFEILLKDLKISLSKKDFFFEPI